MLKSYTHSFLEASIFNTEISTILLELLGKFNYRLKCNACQFILQFVP